MSLFVGKAAKGAPADGRKSAFSGILPSYKVFLAGLFACLLASGCGLQDYVYLEPPENVSESSGAFHFENNEDNDSTVFRGFIVLYRFYATPGAAENARDSISSAYSSSPTTVYQKMTSLGYRQLLFDGAAKLDIEEMDRNDPFAIEINYSDKTNVEIDFIEFTASTFPVLPAVVKRNVTDKENDGFSSDYLIENDEDLKSDQYDDGKTYFQCYVLSYGISTASGGVDFIYSEPKSFSLDDPPEFDVYD